MKALERFAVLACVALAATAWGKPLDGAAPQEPPPEAAVSALEELEAPSKPTLTLEESSATVMAAGTGRRVMKVKVESNVKWTAASQYPWLRVTGGASGTGNGTVKYKVSPYQETGMRSGAIVLEGEGLSQSFMVLQKGVHPSLKLGSHSRVFDASGHHDKELPVSANGAWNAVSSEPWLMIRRGGGEGEGLIIYNVAPNTGKKTRRATITVTGGDLTRTFQVKQKAALVHSVPFWISLALALLVLLLFATTSHSQTPPPSNPDAPPSAP